MSMLQVKPRKLGIFKPSGIQTCKIRPIGPKQNVRGRLFCRVFCSWSLAIMSYPTRQDLQLWIDVLSSATASFAVRGFCQRAKASRCFGSSQSCQAACASAICTFEARHTGKEMPSPVKNILRPLLHIPCSQDNGIIGIENPPERECLSDGYRNMWHPHQADAQPSASILLEPHLGFWTSKVLDAGSPRHHTAPRSSNYLYIGFAYSTSDIMFPALIVHVCSIGEKRVFEMCCEAFCRHLVV